MSIFVQGKFVLVVLVSHDKGLKFSKNSFEFLKFAEVFSVASLCMMSVTESELWRRLKENKDGEAADKLGDRYWNGDGVEQSDAMAFQCFKWGAEYGNRNCIESCGFCCFNGFGADKNKELGLRYYKLAAQAGSVISCHNVARSFELAKDYEAAAVWYQKAVDCKDDDPQWHECRMHCAQWLTDRG